MRAKKEPKTKVSELEVVDGIFMVEKDSSRLIGLKPDIKEAPENMVIPEGVEIIWEGAFVSRDKRQDSHIKSVKFPDSVKKIGEKAFLECVNLTDIQFGNGLECIGKGAFNSCRALEKNSDTYFLPKYIEQTNAELCECALNSGISEKMQTMYNYSITGDASKWQEEYTKSLIAASVLFILLFLILVLVREIREKIQRKRKGMQKKKRKKRRRE